MLCKRKWFNRSRRSFKLSKRLTFRIFCFTVRAAARWKVQKIPRTYFCSVASIIDLKSQIITVLVFSEPQTALKVLIPCFLGHEIACYVCLSPEIRIFAALRLFWLHGKTLYAAFWKCLMILWTRKTGPCYSNSNDFHGFRQQTMPSPAFLAPFGSIEIRWKPLKVVRIPGASLAPPFWAQPSCDAWIHLMGSRSDFWFPWWILNPKDWNPHGLGG